MKDRMFDAMANEHRRSLLVALSKDNPQTVSVPTSGDDGMGATDQRLALEMYHIHLPKLEDDGFVRWERKTGEITKGPQFEEIRPLLQWVDDRAETTPAVVDSQ